ncbi:MULTISPECIES: diacylglycerol kinase family protein [unclassified Streptomyces]|uniref:diacylglycerol kinase family protein n=1 Tax=unclassified Streptomyces TaxID=2593676 RepID=UPI00099CB1BD|nr:MULTISPECIES: diacylglycerol kinase family protein [unclassified Streptomyces]
MTNAHDVGARPGRALLLLPVQTALVAVLGLLVTGPPANHWPLSAEDGVNRALADHRAPFATTLTDMMSLVADTQSVIALTLLCVLGLLLVPPAPRWWEAGFLAVSVAAQSAIFLLVTLVVNRDRPDVPRLDGAPPTSSFPSGHVGASMALYGGLAVLAARHLRGVWRNLVVGLLVLIPPAVAFSRLYRGMHHPSDVVVGLLNGACTLLLVGVALLPNARKGKDGTDPEPEPAVLGTLRAVVVRHPHACGDETTARVRAVLRRHGYAEQRWTDTTPEDPSGALAAHLNGTDADPNEEVDLVVVCGGDGTVRACADVLAGSGTPLAIVPCGTGNLLARNLDLPVEPVAALREALSGRAVGLDVGRVEGDGLAPTRFAVMAGAGFDAAMVRDASPRLKERLGWAAYVLSAARHLRDPRMRLSIRLDGGAPLERRARMVVIGNVGALQGGLPLLPGARPDSGRLEVVLLDPRGVTGWLAAAGYLVSHLPGGRASQASGTRERTAAHGALEYFGAARVDLRFARPQPRELDGDVLAAGTRLTAEVEPGALRVRLPAPTRIGVPEDRTGKEVAEHGHRDARTAAQ